MPGRVRDASDVEGLLRRCVPQALGAVARRHADFAAAEDAVQEASLATSAGPGLVRVDVAGNAGGLAMIARAPSQVRPAGTGPRHRV